MSVDEFQFRKTADELLACYRQLQQAKHARKAAPEVKGRPSAPRPGAPGNAAAIELDIDLCGELHEVVCDARNSVQPGAIIKIDGPMMASWLKYHAYDCAQLDWAGDIVDLMEAQIRRINRLVAPPEVGESLRHQEPWNLDSVIISQLHRLGYRHQRRDLRTWASRGHITSRKRGARAVYRLSEVVDYLEKR